MRRTMVGVLVGIVALSGSLQAQPQGDTIDPAVVGYPQRMVAFGDSITRAFLADGNPNNIADQPQYSWATGTSPEVNSLAERIRTATGNLTATNAAASGATINALVGQVNAANPADAQYATILMGANDVCFDEESDMTSVADYRAQLVSGLNQLTTNEPEARIFIASIPDVFKVWQTFKDNPAARGIWNQFGVCQAMFANPESTAPADMERRQRVRQRIIDFNSQLSEVCSGYLRCRFDQNLLFNSAISPTLVTADFYHPSIAGQRTLASNLAQASFDFTDQAAPVSNVTFSQTQGAWLATLSATDDRGVRGLEYRLPSQTTWTRYTQPIAVADQTTIIVRAVDINGNTEGSRAWSVPAAATYTVFMPFVKLNQ
ncbi:SGNH/GDSL hydrolase family protein [Herpetosiphon giganteus]|uniref:SGNH/GDSL hydrolase family protein n=1 Tax=Herpetosiphon giganteus TaxID=2029754 RepID=UPI00195EE865|nr:SGNH/GDSL hydrolase family protein [Herpetosiphon giganteus]MBM7843520.1 lysophospholipase L1-like esterase [Herpetosiphon giganteus]